MTSRAPSPFEFPALAALRRLLLATLVFGTAGMDAELLLIGHIEGRLQRLPVLVLGLACLSLVWLAARPSRAAVRGVQTLMTLSVLSGVVGIVLHFQGNTAFELEMYPDMAGLDLVQKTLTGATPVLAPGSMALLGLVGLAAVLRLPLIQAPAIEPSAKVASS